MGNDTEILL